ncbi:Hypothetical protein A7982_06371 [Minicystis rosea]|nr:Hypothetical protein A7982_06371 [Minicystis rosea]
MNPWPVDENGWAIGPVTLLPIADAWTLLAPDGDARIDAPRWAHQASTFFRARLAVVQDKRYPSGTLPLADMVELDIARRDDAATTRVLVLTVPVDRAPEAMKAGARGAAAIGGAGFDALVPRTRRVWQVRAAIEGEGDARAPAAAAAVLASVLLAPVVPPGGGTIFGVKGARQKLESLGWRT